MNLAFVLIKDKKLSEKLSQGAQIITDNSCWSFSSSNPAAFSLMKFSATAKVECESSILWISFAYKERGNRPELVH